MPERKRENAKKTIARQIKNELSAYTADVMKIRAMEYVVESWSDCPTEVKAEIPVSNLAEAVSCRHKHSNSDPTAAAVLNAEAGIDEIRLMNLQSYLADIKARVELLSYFVELLPDEIKDVIKLRYYEGKTWRALSVEANCPVSTMNDLLKKGIQMMVELYSTFGRVEECVLAAK